MTCVAGISHKGKVYIGADSAGVDGQWGLVVRADQKVFVNGPFVMGFTTSFRMGQLLQHSLYPPPKREVDSDYRYMVNTFVDGVRQCLKTGGYAHKENEVERGGNFLVGYRGSLYEIGSDYQVGMPRDGCAAVGCGYQFALGAMAVLGKLSPRERILQALQAAESLCAGVRGPFVVLESA